MSCYVISQYCDLIDIMLSVKVTTMSCYVIRQYCDLIDIMLVYSCQDICQAYDSVI
jgi:hypothetical protein